MFGFEPAYMSWPSISGRPAWSGKGVGLHTEAETHTKQKFFRPSKNAGTKALYFSALVLLRLPLSGSVSEKFLFLRAFLLLHAGHPFCRTMPAVAICPAKTCKQAQNRALISMEIFSP